MDQETKSSLRTGIVDQGRYASDSIYRETIDRHNPAAVPPRLKQFPPEYYAQNRREAGDFLIFLGGVAFRAAKWLFFAVVFVFFGGLLWFLAEERFPSLSAPAVVGAGLGVAGVFGAIFTRKAFRQGQGAVARFLYNPVQGAAFFAGLATVPLGLIGGYSGEDGRLAFNDLQALSILVAVYICGFALSLTYRRWTLTGLFAAISCLLLAPAWWPYLT
ncbi:MAG: hypothetical protein AAF618_05460 [Pseudomonadota bacterium]